MGPCKTAALAKRPLENGSAKFRMRPRPQRLPLKHSLFTQAAPFAARQPLRFGRQSDPHKTPCPKDKPVRPI